MADKGLFKRLQRLFSSDVVIRNVGGNQLKVVDTDHIQTSGEFETNALMDRFSGIYQNPASTSLYGAQFNMNYQYLRTFIYSDYDLMDTDAIIASALDIVADECSLKNDMGEVLQIKSSDEDIQKILYNLFYDVLNITTQKVFMVVHHRVTTQLQIKINKMVLLFNLIITKLPTLDYYLM